MGLLGGVCLQCLSLRSKPTPSRSSAAWPCRCCIGATRPSLRSALGNPRNATGAATIRSSMWWTLHGRQAAAGGRSQVDAADAARRSVARAHPIDLACSKGRRNRDGAVRARRTSGSRRNGHPPGRRQDGHGRLGLARLAQIKRGPRVALWPSSSRPPHLVGLLQVARSNGRSLMSRRRCPSTSTPSMSWSDPCADAVNSGNAKW